MARHMLPRLLLVGSLLAIIDFRFLASSISVIHNSNNASDDGVDDEDDDDGDGNETEPSSPLDFCSRDHPATLSQLLVVFRHGDRTPEDIFPTDIHGEDTWPLGYGQLTERGLLRSYELGQWTRECYGSYLSNILSTRRVYVRSSDYDRTLMSLKAHLAGAYPQILGGDFPIHTVPVGTDDVMRGHKNCPRFFQLGEEIDASDRARKIMDEDADFLKMVADKSGVNSTNILRPALIVADSVLVELENNLPIVDWLNEDSLIDKLIFYSDFAFELYYNNAEMARIVGGPLLQDIIDKMTARASGSSTIEHILYSGHSTLMGGLLGSLGAMNNLEPPYASAVIFELHKLDTNKFAVLTYYRNTTTNDPYPITIEGCDSFEETGCTLEEFQAALAQRASKTHAADCAAKQHASPTSATTKKQETVTSSDRAEELASSVVSPSSLSSALIGHAFDEAASVAAAASAGSLQIVV